MNRHSLHLLAAGAAAAALAVAGCGGAAAKLGRPLEIRPLLP